MKVTQAEEFPRGALPLKLEFLRDLIIPSQTSIPQPTNKSPTPQGLGETEKQVVEQFSRLGKDLSLGQRIGIA